MELLQCLVCGNEISTRATRCPQCGDPDPFAFHAAIKLHVATQVAERELEACRDRFETNPSLLLVLPAASAIAAWLALIGLQKWLEIYNIYWTVLDAIVAIPVFFIVIRHVLKKKLADELYAVDYVAEMRGRLVKLEVKVGNSVDLLGWRSALRRGADAILAETRRGAATEDDAFVRRRVARELALQEAVRLILDHRETYFELSNVRVKPHDYSDYAILTGCVRNHRFCPITALNWTVFCDSRPPRSIAANVTVERGEIRPFDANLGDLRITEVRFSGCTFADTVGGR